MDDVAIDAGVTKATVYAHFHSKLDLFHAALAELRRGMLAPEDVVRGPDEEVSEHLRLIAHRLLTLTLDSRTLGIYRMLVLPVTSEPRLGKMVWEHTFVPYRKAVQDVLSRACRRRALDIENPERAAQQFFGLVLGDTVVRMLLMSAIPDLGIQEKAAYVDTAVTLFLSGYSPR